MTEKFLKAKHWQIFMVTFGLPFLIQIIMMLMTIIGNDPTIIINGFSVIMILFVGGFLAWFWSIGVGLQIKVPNDVKMKVKKFKVFLVIPLVYMLFISISMGSIFNEAFENGLAPKPGIIGSIVGIIVPLHFFSMFCIFYCLYFVAKTFKTVELQREVSFSDFAGEFFMIWFFPIGIWIVQPKVNKMIEEQK
ncbi:hypothetical protein BZG02_14250 [Labilibaculum filiforme]|uniref:Uncharacterized protein n=1 Tax=Labilibaculum filiforme TaxID=1940526 RepID=A0A2N3HVN1_9BACT|nr:hypothetical protein [Labilibaculum filiforme]PKQ62088.1 hypothetical protein BZG02_14250 [Labilibaculum filiforme]